MPESETKPGEELTRRHLVAGWAGLLVFLTMGLLLEALHGMKAGFYLDPPLANRRLLWTLAHAHGTLLALVQIAFALSLPHVQSVAARSMRVCSGCLVGALVVMPLGFFLGGVKFYGGDPGLGVLLVPVGGCLLFLAVAVMLREILRGGGLDRGKPGGRDAHQRGRSRRRGP